ncbi:MAG: potassium transporter TrkG [Dehalococcoidia bacterium]
MQQRGSRRPGARAGNVRVRIGRRRAQETVVHRRPVRRPRQPSVVLLLGGFAGLIITGTVLLALPIASRDGHSAGFLTALFTSTSAVCVTGLVVVDTWDHWSTFGQVVIALLIQLGGLGFMTSSTLLLLVLRRRVSLAQRLVTAETLGVVGSRDIRHFVRRIVIATLLIEAAGAVVLTLLFAANDGGLSGRQIWRGTFTAISAFNNAGFDLEGGFHSLTLFSGNAPILGSVAALMVLGGTGFAVWTDIARHRRWRPLAVDTKIVIALSLALWGLGAGVLLFDELQPGGALEGASTLTAGVDATALSVFARTSGFSPVDLTEVRDEMLFFLSGLMFIGGASASTAGGIKLTTFAILGFAIIASLRGEAHVTAFERELPWRLVNRALSVALLAVGLVFAAAFTLALTSEQPFTVMFFEAVSAFSNTGLSAGVTTTLDTAGRLLIILVMYVGRLGPLTVALALAGRDQLGGRFRYAEEQVSIG